MAIVRGIDVHPIYQKITDWGRVAEHVRFVFVKFTEGRALLPWQRDGANDSHTYVKRARAAGLLTGTYHVCHPGRNSPAQEAGFYAAQLEAAGWEPGRDLPPVLDIEPRVVLASGENVRGARLTDWSFAFYAHLDGHFGLTDPWQRTGVYVGQSIFGYVELSKLHAGRWFWHGGYPLSTWPTSMPTSTPAAVYQRVGPVSLVPGVSGSGLDVDIARSEDLARMAPDSEGDDMPLDSTDLAKIEDLLTKHRGQYPTGAPIAISSPAAHLYSWEARNQARVNAVALARIEAAQALQADDEAKLTAAINAAATAQTALIVAAVRDELADAEINIDPVVFEAASERATRRVLGGLDA